MPLRTLRRLLGRDDPEADIFEQAGLARVRGGWQGVLGGPVVRIEQAGAVPLLRAEPEVRITIPCPHGVVLDEDWRLTWAVRRQLDHLQEVGTVSADGGTLTLRAIGEPTPSKVLGWARRLAIIVTALNHDEESIAKLVALQATDPSEALQLARRLRRRNVGFGVRTHADALVRRGRKLRHLVEGPTLPVIARCWAAERLAARYVDDVVDELLDRPRHAADLEVLAVLAEHQEVALLLAHHGSFWTEQLAKIAHDGHPEALASLLAVLVRRQPGPWVDVLLPALRQLPPPLESAALEAVGRHGSREALGVVGAVLEEGVRWESRGAWSAARTALQDRFGGHAGGVSLAETTGGLGVAEPGPRAKPTGT